MIAKYKNHILAILFFKILIICLLPLTGDEAYFIKWGQHLSIGYYDHPPMVGWLIYIISFINDSYITFRLFSFFSALLISYLIYKILLELKVDKESSIFVGILFLVMPIDILMSLFTNDIPLALFGTIGTYFFVKSFNSKCLQNSILAGIFFGLSFLSKYFLVFLVIGLFIFALYQYKKKAIKNILIVMITMIPFVLENLYFNYNSCWNNIMFNFFARTKDLHYHLKTVLGYIFILIYLLTPWGLYFLIKSKENFNKYILSFILFSSGVGLFVFLMVSLKAKIGLHWLLLFMPYLIMLFVFVSDRYREKLIKYNIYFTYTHIAILLVILLIPVTLLKDSKKYKDILLFTKTKEICQKIDKYSPLFTTGYTSSSILSYYCKKDIHMILNNSKYGRLDDKLLNIKNLENKTIYIFDKRNIDKNKLLKVFQEVEIIKVPFLNQMYYIAKCKNLKYENYKKLYLDIQKDKFYNIPDWLPKGKCYFLDRYYK